MLLVSGFTAETFQKLNHLAASRVVNFAILHILSMLQYKTVIQFVSAYKFQLYVLNTYRNIIYKITVFKIVYFNFSSDKKIIHKHLKPILDW